MAASRGGEPAGHLRKHKDGRRRPVAVAGGWTPRAPGSLARARTARGGQYPACGLRAPLARVPAALAGYCPSGLCVRERAGGAGTKAAAAPPARRTPGPRSPRPPAPPPPPPRGSRVRPGSARARGAAVAHDSVVFGGGPAGLPCARPGLGGGCEASGTRAGSKPAGTWATGPPCPCRSSVADVAGVSRPRSLSWRQWSAFPFVSCMEAGERETPCCLLRGVVFWGKARVIVY